ncbi:UNKNOWN [Stylonychia lemnae]|uniref:Uncharacterized protein n=1 Tax=Stylonychia lemnae TaxID=5949 RepID=A0A078AEM4_STYLE|nr:UNKNOWN [Stylonychia lemnae]|eukprot:CDW79922.1 UNKNOWN [Stylonychia lemnae]
MDYQNNYQVALIEQVGQVALPPEQRIQNFHKDSLHKEISNMSLRAMAALNRPSHKSVMFAMKILPILKMSIKHPDRIFYFDQDSEHPACCHNGYILYLKKSSSNQLKSPYTANSPNLFNQKFICRKLIDDPDKFDRSHCSFEIEVLKITEDEGKVQIQRNYHAAHKDDFNFYNQVLFTTNKNTSNGSILPISGEVQDEFRNIISTFENNSQQALKRKRKFDKDGNMIYDEDKKMLKAQRYLELERTRTMMRLNLENQLRKIITNDMEIKVIKICKEEAVADSIDELINRQKRNKAEINNLKQEEPPKKTSFNRDGNFIRNAYLIYLHQMLKDDDRIKITNLKLYIEGTFNSMSEINYEVFILRTFIAEATAMVSFGMLLIPKEQLYGNDEELQQFTLDLCFKSIVKVFSLYNRHIFFASKKGMAFVNKIKRIINAIDPTIEFRLCFNNYSYKIMDILSKQTPRDLADDQNLVNYEQQEMIYYQLRSLCFLPKEYIDLTLDLMHYISVKENHEDSTQIIMKFRQDFCSDSEHYDIWNLYGIGQPFQNSYEDDWQLSYRDQWRIKQIQSSRTLVDLIANLIRNENKRVDYILYRIQKNLAEGKQKCTQGFQLSKKPYMMQDLIDGQLERLTANIRMSGYGLGLGLQARDSNYQINQAAVAGFSIRTFLSREEEEAFERKRNEEIAQHCLIFTRKMSKAIEKISEYI